MGREYWVGGQTGAQHRGEENRGTGRVWGRALGGTAVAYRGHDMGYYDRQIGGGSIGQGCCSYKGVHGLHGRNAHGARWGLGVGQGGSGSGYKRGGHARGAMGW